MSEISQCKKNPNVINIKMSEISNIRNINMSEISKFQKYQNDRNIEITEISKCQKYQDVRNITLSTNRHVKSIALLEISSMTFIKALT